MNKHVHLEVCENCGDMVEEGSLEYCNSPRFVPWGAWLCNDCMETQRDIESDEERL